jgi:hypothetical protein
VDVVSKSGTTEERKRRYESVVRNAWGTAGKIRGNARAHPDDGAVRPPEQRYLVSDAPAKTPVSVRLLRILGVIALAEAILLMTFTIVFGIVAAASFGGLELMGLP